jgi:predicted transcriptional regulator
MGEEGRIRAGARPDLYVVARFLAKLHPGHGPEVRLSRSKLQMAVAVNYDVFRKYLQLLLERGLIEEVRGEQDETQLRLTEAGLRAHDDLVAWLESMFGRRPFGADAGR